MWGCGGGGGFHVVTCLTSTLVRVALSCVEFGLGLTIKIGPFVAEIFTK